ADDVVPIERQGRLSRGRPILFYDRDLPAGLVHTAHQRDMPDTAPIEQQGVALARSRRSPIGYEGDIGRMGPAHVRRAADAPPDSGIAPTQREVPLDELDTLVREAIRPHTAVVDVARVPVHGNPIQLREDDAPSRAPHRTVATCLGR